jgi:hypothetical protein
MIHSHHSKIFLSLLSASLLIGFSEPSFAARTKRVINQETKEQEDPDKKKEELSEDNNDPTTPKERKIDRPEINFDEDNMFEFHIEDDNDLFNVSFDIEDNMFEFSFEDEANPLKRSDPDRDSEEEDELAPPNKNLKPSYNFKEHLTPLPYIQTTPEELKELIDRANNGDEDLHFELVKRKFWEDDLPDHSPFSHIDSDALLTGSDDFSNPNWIIEKAKENDFYAWYVLSQNRIAVKMDKVLIMDNLRARAVQGNPIAQYVLFRQDPFNNSVYLSKSAKNLFPLALVSYAGLGTFALNALISKKEETRELVNNSLQWAAEAGHIPSQIHLLDLLGTDLFIKKKELADQGLGSYQIEVALAYYTGDNVEQNKEKAFEYLGKVKWCSKHELKRIVKNMVNKFNELDVHKDKKFIEALGKIPDLANASYKLWKKSRMGSFLICGVRLNHSDSLADYAELYWAKSEYKKALIYFEKAASLGNPRACLALGRAYLTGCGVEFNPEKAKMYFFSAIYKKNVSIVREIGALYWRSHTLKNNRKDAWHFWSTIPTFKKLLDLIGDPSQVDEFPLSPLTLCSLKVNLIDKIPILNLRDVILSTAPLMEFMLSEDTRNLLLKIMHKLHEAGYKQQEGLTPEELMSYWVKILGSDNVEQIKVLTGFIPNVITELGLSDTDELYIETVNAGIRLSHEGDEMCPYAFFKRLKEKQSQVIKIPHFIETIGDMAVRLNVCQFQTLSERVCRAQDLPDVSTYFKEMCTHLSKQGSNLKFCDKVLAMTGSTWEQIQTGSLGSYYLENLLKLKNSDDIVTSTRWKFIRSIEFLRKTYPDVTECEAHFVKMLAGIQNCQTGKNDGIAGYYSELQRAHGLTTGNSIAPANNMNHEEAAASDFVTELCLQKYENVMRGVETSFLNEVVGIKQGEHISQISHQVQYVTSLLGSKPVFDPHSHLVCKELVVRSKQEVSDIFFKLFTTQYLISSIIETSAKDLKFYGKVLALVPEKERDEAFDINTNTGVTSLTPKGAIKVLRRTGFLEIEE